MARRAPARTQRCVRCGGQAQENHHRVTRSRGGPDDPYNVVPLCASDHRWVGANPNAAEAVGLYVRGHFVRGRYVGPDEQYRARYSEEVR